jgi:hypothetical protein
LHFAFESAQGIFQRLTLLDNYFSHFKIHPQSGSDWFLAASQYLADAVPVYKYRM